MEILEYIVRSFTSMSIIYFFAALAEKGNSIPLKGNQLQVSFGKSMAVELEEKMRDVWFRSYDATGYKSQRKNSLLWKT